MPDENYFVDIAYGGGTFTFPITPKIFPRLDLNWKRSGHEVAVNDVISAHGWFSEADQDAVIARWATLQAIAVNKRFVSVVFRKESGTVIHSLGRAIVRRLDSVDHDAGFVNHLEFEIEFAEERSARFSGLVDVSHEDEEIQEVDENGDMIAKFRRHVMATGEYGSTSNARQFVESLRPNRDNLTRESIRTVNYDGVVEGTWEYDDTENKKKGGLVRWEEHVTYMPGQRSFAFHARESGAPLLLQGGYLESRISVSGTIERYDKGFPSASELFDYYRGNANAKTAIVLENPVQGMPFVSRYKVDDPVAPEVWSITYSYTLVFGEENAKPGTYIDSRGDQSRVPVEGEAGRV